MKKVFVDTGVFLALLVKNELSHKAVSKQYEEYKQTKAQFLTSDYILDELFTRCLAGSGVYLAQRAVSLVSGAQEHSELNVLQVDEVTFRRAKEVFLKFAEHKLSFTDATTYVLCKELALDEVFTLDSGFKKVGLKTSF